MKIEKVNENQICCTLTRADLEDRQIKISELAYGSEKARGLFRDMIQQANYEFGFEANDIPLMVEAIPMSSESIVLLITKVEYPEELDTRFSKFTEADEQEYSECESQEISEPQGADDILDLFEKIRRDKAEVKESGQKASKNQEKTVFEKAAEQVKPEVAADLIKLFEFSRLDQVERFAHVLGDYYHGENTLFHNYKQNNYQLILHKSRHSPEEFNKVCNVASEYGKQKKYTPAVGAYYREHQCQVIEKDALQILNRI